MATTSISPKTSTSGLKESLKALPWLTPVLLLIVGVVAFPTLVMLFTSFRKISKTGLDRGFNGIENYIRVFETPGIVRVLLNTVIWVVLVVLLTIVFSLLLAHILNKAFPGRQLVRIAVIFPWAASVVMSTTVVYYALEPQLGIVNRVLYQLGITASDQVGYTKTAIVAFTVAILVAVFVSLPFTTYTILAGLQAVPKDVIEAAHVDGASPARTYFSIILPQLRSAIATATIINIINVFNSLPILKVITGPIPGHDGDTTTTLLFKFIEVDRHLDWASALSIINFAIVIIVIAIYVIAVKPMKQVDE